MADCPNLSESGRARGTLSATSFKEQRFWVLAVSAARASGTQARYLDAEETLT
jgi:hypothetical protein